MKDFYVVWNPAAGPPSRQHETRGEAQTEAERLAERSKGEAFYVLHAVSVSISPKPVETTILDGDGIPF
jgi:hypothetical protein